MDRRRPVARRARTCAPAPGSPRFDSKPYAGKCSASSAIIASRVTFATTDAAATESDVWSPLMIVRTSRGTREVVVVAVEDDAVGLEALRRELGERAARGAAQRLGHARARRTPRGVACPTPMPRAQPRTARRRDFAFGRRQHLRVADAAAGARRRARPRRRSPARPTNRVRPRRCRTTTRSPASQHFRSRRRVGARARAARTRTLRNRADRPASRRSGHARARSTIGAGETRDPRRGALPVRSALGARLRGRRAGRNDERPRRYRVRRRSDGSVLPVLFDDDDVREERRRHACGGSEPTRTGASRRPSARRSRSSTGIAWSVVVRIVPRAASMIAAFAMVSSSGASMMFRKSYCPISAYCAMHREAHRLDLFASPRRMRSGFWRSVSQPSGPSVESIT